MVKNILFKCIVSVWAIVAFSDIAKASLATDYFRTKQSGNWNDINTWESSVDNIVWSDATLIPNTDASKIQIRYGHTGTVTANITLDDVEIDVGGTVDVLSGITLIIANGAATIDFGVSGILKSEGTVTPMGSLVFRSQGVYQHNYKTSPGTIPLATWEDGSDCQIIGFTSSNGGIQGANQNFFNLTWNCPNQRVNTGPSLLIIDATVRNNFTILSTGLGGANLSVTNSDLKIKNLLQYDGYFALINTNNASLTTTLRVSGDVNLQGGYFAKGSGSSSGVIIFSGTSEQKIDINSGHFYGALRFQVSENSIVNLTTSTISNIVTGTFTVQDGATLITAHPEGIALTGTTGVIQSTGTRTFSPNANYIYNGTTAQQTGTGLPAIVNNLTIDNSSGVTLRSGNLTVNGSLNISNGYLDLGASALITAGSVGLSGSGVLRTQNTSVNPLSTGKTWNGTIEYNGSATQNIVSGQYNNLKLSGSAKALTGNLSISNDFDVSGVSSVNTGTYKISYNGSGNQNVAGIAYYDLDVAGAGTKTITALATVSNNVTVNNAILNANGNLTLLANETSNANIAPLIGSADIIGNVNVQTFLSGGIRGNKTLSSPINDGMSANNTFSQLKNYMIVTGANGTSAGFDAVPSGAASANILYTYDNNLASPFVPVSNISNQLTSGKGFIYYFLGNRDYKDIRPGKLLSPFVTPENVTLTYTGNVNKGNIDLSIDYNAAKDNMRGAYIAGNPYPSTIDWEKVYSSSSNISGSITVVRGGGRPYATYNAVAQDGTNGGSRYIQPGQGFYVYANVGGGTLSFRELHKEIDAESARLLSAKNKVELISATGKVLNSRVVLNSNPIKKLRLQLQTNELKEEALIAFGAGFHANLDKDDSPYNSSYSLKMATLSSDNKAAAINLMPEIEYIESVKLSINSTNSSNVTLNFTSIPDLAGKSMILKDNYLNKEILINTENSIYDFFIDKSISSSYGDERLSLAFVPSTVLPVLFSDVTIALKNRGAELKWTVASEVPNSTYEIVRSTDGITFETIAVIEGTENATAVKSYSFLDSNPINAVNYYKIKEIDPDGKYIYSKIVSIDFSVFQQTKGNLRLYPNPTDNFVRVNSVFEESVLVIVSDINGKKLKNITYAPKESIVVDISDLNSGLYTLELKNSMYGKEQLGISKFIKK